MPSFFQGTGNLPSLTNVRVLVIGISARSRNNQQHLGVGEIEIVWREKPIPYLEWRQFLNPAMNFHSNDTIQNHTFVRLGRLPKRDYRKDNQA